MMDKRTEDIEMAVNGLKGIASILEPLLLAANYEGLGNEDVKELRRHLNMAAKALEKQASDTPREHYHWGLFTEEEKQEESRWFCPQCDGALDESWNNCAWCGQRLEWE